MVALEKCLSSLLLSHARSLMGQVDVIVGGANPDMRMCCLIACSMLFLLLLLSLQGPLQLFSWSDSLAGSASLHTTPGGPVIHACADLAQLAMWLGVGKVGHKGVGPIVPRSVVCVQ